MICRCRWLGTWRVQDRVAPITWTKKVIFAALFSRRSLTQRQWRGRINWFLNFIRPRCRKAVTSKAGWRATSVFSVSWFWGRTGLISLACEQRLKASKIPRFLQQCRQRKDNFIKQFWTRRTTTSLSRADRNFRWLECIRVPYAD